MEISARTQAECITLTAERILTSDLARWGPLIIKEVHKMENEVAVYSEKIKMYR